MRIPIRVSAVIGALLLAALATGFAQAQEPSGFSSNAFSSPSTRVPVSALGRPAAWFDPSRLHIAQSFSMGSGFGGSTGLSVTSFRYQFAAPLSMSVNVGSVFGAGARDGSKFFLEGMNLQYRPTANSMIQFEYHDFRSPLQYQAYRNSSFSGPWGY